MNQFFTYVAREERIVSNLIIADNTYLICIGSRCRQFSALTKQTWVALIHAVAVFDADVIFDGGYQGTSGGAPSAHMYFLNTDYIFFRPHKRSEHGST